MLKNRLIFLFLILNFIKSECAEFDWKSLDGKLLEKCAWGKAKDVADLLAQGASINILHPNWKKSPLEIAVCRPSFEMVKLLVENGAFLGDLNAPEKIPFGMRLGQVFDPELPIFKSMSWKSREEHFEVQVKNCKAILQVALWKQYELQGKEEEYRTNPHGDNNVNTWDWQCLRENQQKIQQIIDYLKNHFEYLKKARAEVHAFLDKQNQDDSGYAPGFLPPSVVNIVNEYL